MIYKGFEPGGGLHMSFPGFIDACWKSPAVCCLGMMCEEIEMGTLWAWKHLVDRCTYLAESCYV